MAFIGLTCAFPRRRTPWLAKNGEETVGSTDSGHLRHAGTLGAMMVLLGLLLGGCSGTSARSDEDAAANTGSSPPPSGGNPPPSGGTDAPVISFSASPLTVDEGGASTLTWSATNADSCSASGGWTGDRNTSGTVSTGPLTAGTTFSLTCTGAGGSALEMISIAVVGPVQLSWAPPTENVDGSPLTDLSAYRIYYGDASRSYDQVVVVGNPAATSYTLSLASGDYYVAMTAVDADGNESAYSNEVIKTRL